MVKKVDKESSASPMVKKSGAKAAKGLGLDKVKSAMTPDKVKISTPAKSEKKKEKVKIAESEAVATPSRTSKKLVAAVKLAEKSESTPKSAKKKESEDTAANVMGKFVGKVVFYHFKQKYGHIQRNDAKDGDKDVYFRDQDVPFTHGLEVQFDLTEEERGPRAENVKILDTPENELLKAEAAQKAAELAQKAAEFTSKRTRKPVEKKKHLKEDKPKMSDADLAALVERNEKTLSEMSGAIKATEYEEEVDNADDVVESQPTEKAEPKVIEKKVVGIIFRAPNHSKHYGFITRKDATDDDEKVYFRSDKGIYTPGFEVEFDVAETEEGKRCAVNIKILDTLENKLLEPKVVKAERVKKDAVNLKEVDKEIVAEGVKAHVLACYSSHGFLERADGKGKLWFPKLELKHTDAEGMCWNQRVMEGDTVLCDVAYKYRDNNIKRLSNYNYVACNIRGVDGGPLENSRKFLPRGNKRDGEVQVKAEEKKPAKKVAPLQRTTIENGVDAFLKMLTLSEKVQKDKIDLLGEEEDEAKLFLQIAGIKVPQVKDTLCLKAKLPHPYLKPDAGTLLIVGDLEKSIRVDHAETLRYWTGVLQEAEVDLTDINVMPLRQLRAEFMEHSTRKHLAKSYEKVLCDSRLAGFIMEHLGVSFFKRRKYPIAVDINNKRGKELKEEIAGRMRTAFMPIENKGLSATAHVARVNMDQQQIVENIETFMEAVRQRYPGGWINVRSVCLMTGNGSAYGTRSLILYTSLLSVNEVGYVKTINHDTVGKMTAVTDELSTIPGAEVTVLRNGEVRVKRTQDDPEWDEIEGNYTLEEYMDENYDQNQYLKKMSQLMKFGKRAHEDDSQDEEVHAGGSGDKKKKKNDEESEDESDLELDEMETEYMRKIAEEEEEIERQEEENMKKLKEEAKKNGEDVEEDESEVEDFEDEESEEEESEIDDDIEVENMVESEEEGSEGEDDELLMKRKEEAEISEDEAPKKNKTKKQLKKAFKLAKKVEASKRAKSRSSKSPAAANKSPKGVKSGKIQKKKK